MKLRIKFSHLIWAIISLFTILFLTMGICNHYFLRTFAYDYGNYNFAFWDYSHFRISPVPSSNGTFLQDHYSYLLMYFVPTYWLFNWITGSYTLIIIQNILVVIAGYYSFKLIMFKTNDKWLGLFVLLLYFMQLGRYTSFTADVNLAIISSTFIPVFFYHFEKKNYAFAAILFFLSIFSRENIPIWFVFIFTLLLIEHRKEKKVLIISSAGIIISVMFFIILFQFLIPSVATEGRKYVLFNYSALGNNPGEAINFVFHHPMDTLQLFLSNNSGREVYDYVKAEFYIVMLFSGAFLLFAKPQYLIVFIPLIAQKVLNDFPLRWGIVSYYMIEISTVLPLFAILAVSAIKIKWLKYNLAALACVSTLYITIHKLDVRNQEISFASFPEKEVFYKKGFFKTSYDLGTLYSNLTNIPNNASVSASEGILPHLAQREKIYFFPSVNDAEYIALSTKHNNYLYSADLNQFFRDYYYYSPYWLKQAEIEPLVILKSDISRSVQDTVIICDFEKTDKTNRYFLFSNREIAEYKKSGSMNESHSGSVSLLLNDNKTTAFHYHPIDSRLFSKYVISVWTKSDSFQGFLIAESKNGLSIRSNKAVDSTTQGWKKIELQIATSQLSSGDLNISAGNSGKSPAYFDDLVIRKIK